MIIRTSYFGQCQHVDISDPVNGHALSQLEHCNTIAIYQISSAIDIVSMKTLHSLQNIKLKYRV